MEHPLDPLVDVMARLRSEDGCPWDREQDHRSLKRYLVEEAYEVLDAIDSGDDAALVEELGDLLLQVVFHAQIASESGRFDVDDVIARITEKMIRRHPHVFGDAVASDAQAVLAKWEEIKKEERKEGAEGKDSLMDGVPRELPALMYAREVQKRAARVGFEWGDVTGALQKVPEEVAEIVEASRTGDRASLAAEWGDLLFTLVNVSRYLDVDSEAALRDAAKRFAARFRSMEAQAKRAKRDLETMDLAEMDALWERAKRKERK